MQVLIDRLKEFEQSNNKIKILDIGSWFAPCKQATHMVDIMPFNTMNIDGAYGFGELKINESNYFQLNVNDLKRLPFEDNEFDYIICRHILEDIRDPLIVCKEMMRVGKAGYIETPSRLYESTKGVERPQWCGHYHHRWLVEVINNELVFQFKPHNIHSRSNFFFRRFPWQKMKAKYKNTYLEWEDNFKYRENIIIDHNAVKKNLKDFKDNHKNLDMFRSRWSKDTL